MRLANFAKCLALTSILFSTHSFAADADRDARHAVLRDTRGTYCSPPRLASGRVDVATLLQQLVDLKANSYSFCIHVNAADWDDLKLFLPAARERGIWVWASILPPSESPPIGKMSSEPFKLDVERWAVELAKLSLAEPSLVAWSIDDFTRNLKVFTPTMMKTTLDAARAINPRLAFIPCCYFKAITPDFAKNYASLLDGILFPYRDESGGANLKKWDSVEAEVKRVKELVGPEIPVCIDVYATAHSRLGASTPEYVSHVMTLGHASADGVLVYCHQDPARQPEKYKIVHDLFNQWAEAGAKP